MIKRKKNTSKSKDDESVRVVEEEIHPDIFSEFYRYLEESHEKVISETWMKIKRELTELAKTGSIEAFREIERVIGQGSLISKEEMDFAKVALNFCRFKIENELFDIPTDMISSGLGGVKNKIRYFVALVGKEGITEERFAFLKKAFKKATKVRDSILEEAKLHDFYVSLLILGSLDYAIGDILDSGIGSCDFLQADYYVTNVEIPSDDRIRDWLDGKLDEED